MTGELGRKQVSKYEMKRNRIGLKHHIWGCSVYIVALWSKFNHILEDPNWTWWFLSLTRRIIHASKNTDRFNHSVPVKIVITKKIFVSSEFWWIVKNIGECMKHQHIYIFKNWLQNSWIPFFSCILQRQKLELGRFDSLMSQTLVWMNLFHWNKLFFFYSSRLTLEHCDTIYYLINFSFYFHWFWFRSKTLYIWWLKNYFVFWWLVFRWNSAHNLCDRCRDEDSGQLECMRLQGLWEKRESNYVKCSRINKRGVILL